MIRINYEKIIHCNYHFLVKLRRLKQKIAQKGGTCLMQGFPQRQIGEINRLVPKDAKASHEKISLSFQDGSILSHLASFRNILMLNKEFEDDGD
ncbi:unnamed protein product [Paramecium pentaurelia]|uniref:Uncharacterized protein n=1 Tax=Paramecium pentaurelia TaxID=43138 RepID=A0A8S1TBH8_9CILI|nr:unnamed protein product [Paramecium pentaurelia]